MIDFLSGFSLGALFAAWLCYKHEQKRTSQIMEHCAQTSVQIINDDRARARNEVANAYNDGWLDSLRINVGEEDVEVTNTLRVMEWNERGREQK